MQSLGYRQPGARDGVSNEGSGPVYVANRLDIPATQELSIPRLLIAYESPNSRHTIFGLHWMVG